MLVDVSRKGDDYANGFLGVVFEGSEATNLDDFQIFNKYIWHKYHKSFGYEKTDSSISIFCNAECIYTATDIDIEQFKIILAYDHHREEPVVILSGEKDQYYIEKAILNYEGWYSDYMKGIRKDADEQIKEDTSVEEKAPAVHDTIKSFPSEPVEPAIVIEDLLSEYVGTTDEETLSYYTMINYICASIDAAMIYKPINGVFVYITNYNEAFKRCVALHHNITQFADFKKDDDYFIIVKYNHKADVTITFLTKVKSDDVVDIVNMVIVDENWNDVWNYIKK